MEAENLVKSIVQCSGHTDHLTCGKSKLRMCFKYKINANFKDLHQKKNLKHLTNSGFIMMPCYNYVIYTGLNKIHYWNSFHIFYFTVARRKFEIIYVAYVTFLSDSSGTSKCVNIIFLIKNKTLLFVYLFFIFLHTLNSYSC